MKQNFSISRITQPLLPESDSSFLVSRRFLRSRLLVYSFARFGIAVCIAAGAWFAPYIIGIENLPSTTLYLLAGVIFVYNALIFSLLYFPPWETSKSYLYLTILMNVTISVDFVFLTIALWLVGGATSPFASFYILHIMLAAMLLPRVEVFLQALFGYVLFTLLVLIQWLELAPVIQPAGAVLPNNSIDWRYAVTLLLVQALLLAVTTVLVSEMAAALKQGERSLRKLNAELKQVSEMRRDFLHLVSHNLKAPAAAATMLLMTIESVWAKDMPESAHNAIKRAYARTQELGKLVQDLQQLVSLESGILDSAEVTFSLNEITQKLAEEYRETAGEKKQTIEMRLEENLPQIHAVPRLIREAAVNYVTNAIKYTPEGGVITLRTRSGENEIHFEVEDTGVGISQEHLDTLFGEFVRAPAQVSGQQPPGIGLGLSIVRRILKYYDGRVYVTSEFGKGSVFGFALPLTRSQNTTSPKPDKPNRHP